MSRNVPTFTGQLDTTFSLLVGIAKIQLNIGNPADKAIVKRLAKHVAIPFSTFTMREKNAGSGNEGDTSGDRKDFISDGLQTFQ